MGLTGRIVDLFISTTLNSGRGHLVRNIVLTSVLVSEAGTYIDTDSGSFFHVQIKTRTKMTHNQAVSYSNHYTVPM
jgi:hypothetical protein